MVVLLVASIVLFWGGGASAQDNVAFAQQRFARGVQLYDAGDHLQAAKEFEASLQLYESPNSRLYLARAYGKLNKLGEAMTEYQRAARESADRAGVDPRYAQTRDAALAEIAAWEPRVAHLVIRVAPGPKQLTARVGDRLVPQAALGLPIAVTPGPVEVRVSSPGHQPFLNTVATNAGATVTVEVTLVPAVTDTQRAAVRWRWAGWITVGVGAAALAAGGIFGLMAQSQYHDLVTNCGFAACVPAQPDAVARGKRWEQLMDVSLIGGAIAAVAGGVMLAVGYRTLESPDELGSADSSRVAGRARREAPLDLAVGWTGRTLTLQGHF